MKRIFVSFTAAVVVALVSVATIFYACKKESGNHILAKAGVSKETIVAWLSTQKETGHDNSFIGGIQQKANWQAASTAPINNERQLLLVPLEAGSDLILMLNSNNAQILLGFVAGTGFDGPQKSSSKAQLWADYFAEKKGSFSGSMRAASLQNEFLFEYHWQNGKQTYGRKVLPIELKGFSSGNITPVTTGSVCTDFYLVTSWSDGSQTYEYMFSSCRSSEWGCGLLQAFPGYGNVLLSYGGCNGGSGSVGGGGSKENNSSVKEIIDSLSNPCHKAVLQSLMANGLGNDITGILKNTFGTNDLINIQFANVLTLSEPLTDAKSSYSSSMGTYTVLVNMNESRLQHSSREYIAETMFHEVLHGYLKSKSSTMDELSQHIEMATAFLDKEVAALREVFPELSSHDAKCLVIGGYNDIQRNNPGFLEKLLSGYNLELDDVENTNERFRTGKKGNKC